MRQRSISAVLTVLTIFFLLRVAQAQQQPIISRNQTFVVELLKPISTQTCRKGDPVNAVVREPKQFEGSEMTGTISKIKAAKRGVRSGHSELVFSFDSLRYNEQDIPVYAYLTQVSNSKGLQGVDEEGRVIGKSSGAKRAKAAVGGALAGALIGGLINGGNGALAGAAIGGAAAYVVATTVSASGESVEFEKGARFTLDVTQSGPPVSTSGTD